LEVALGLADAIGTTIATGPGEDLGAQIDVQGAITGGLIETQLVVGLVGQGLNVGVEVGGVIAQTDGQVAEAIEGRRLLD